MNGTPSRSTILLYENKWARITWVAGIDRPQRKEAIRDGRKWDDNGSEHNGK